MVEKESGNKALNSKLCMVWKDLKLSGHKPVTAEEHVKFDIYGHLIFFFPPIGDILLPRLFSCDLYLKTAKKSKLFFGLTQKAQEKYAGEMH